MLSRECAKEPIFFHMSNNEKIQMNDICTFPFFNMHDMKLDTISCYHNNISNMIWYKLK